MGAFLKAKLTNGEEVVSRFEKVTEGSNYVREVFGGGAPFNAWRPVAKVHPKSGESINIRTREFINPRHIISIQKVEPIPGQEAIALDTMRAEHFQPVPQLQKTGTRGIYVVPSPAPMDDLTPGDQYPIHRDDQTLRDYIIVSVARDGQDERRFFIEQQGSGVFQSNSESEDDLDGFSDIEESERW